MVFPLSATPAAPSSFGAGCGFNRSGNNVQATAYTDTTYQVANIYAHLEFYRDGAYLGTWNDDGVNRSHAQAFSSWNYSLPWEHPTYRVKSWHNIKDHTAWHTVVTCDFTWTKT